ncbi:high affinity cationic amino acid transporter 1-like [Schistocerca serialis cubense]|uniref:high affinity cationic amino acid transporter 1-like n=1 Tax=Schistocerca serialis cubense TaxID=2023355 RepID=UPI00214EED60|nr:high affinity cationic amino acid transporter 1-like [Schistocerca serialis cubense]
MLRTLLHKISQKKSSDINDIAQSHLARILNLFDLVGIGVGTGLGLGVYVIPGTVSRYYAGPGVLTSFSIAAVASVIAGLCYAELSARFPRAGCAYIYSFVTIGELVAFIVGWTLIMVYVLGTASIARSLAGHIDFIANNSMSATLKDELPITAEFLSSYPDFLAFGITLLLSLVYSQKPENGGSTVTPLYEEGDKFEAANYRPVSVFIGFGKILEKLFLSRLTAVLIKKMIVCDSQHGFRTDKSTQLTIFPFLDETVTAVDEGRPSLFSLFLTVVKFLDATHNNPRMSSFSLQKWIPSSIFLWKEVERSRPGAFKKTTYAKTDHLPNSSLACANYFGYQCQFMRALEVLLFTQNVSVQAAVISICFLIMSQLVISKNGSLVPKVTFIDGKIFKSVYGEVDNGLHMKCEISLATSLSSDPKIEIEIMVGVILGNYQELINRDKQETHYSNVPPPCTCTQRCFHPQKTIEELIVLAFCVKIFSSIMNITAAINFAVLLFIIIAGSLQADINNWQIQENQVPEGTEGGKGGFMPFGILGILKGAAIYFQAFIGFDSVASTGEEVTNPQRNIPMASMISLMTVFCGYFGVSGVITLMLPYYYQDADVPILYAFQKTSWGWAQWIVSIGAISSLSTSFLGGMFSLSRLLYAMSSDDLLFKFMGKVHPRFRTPFIGTLCAGVLTGLMALIFDVDELIDMMSVGALVAYSVAAACVLLLRYAKDADNYTETEHADDHFHIKDIVKQIMNTEKLKKPTKLSTFIVTSEIILYIVLCVLVSQLVIQARSSIGAADPLAITGLVILLLCMICIMVSIGIQPTSQATVTYKVPFVPLFPAIGILINIFLMMMLDGVTWIKCGAWTLKGLVIYIVFGFCCHYKKWKSTSNTSPRMSRNSVVVQKTSSRW